MTRLAPKRSAPGRKSCDSGGTDRMQITTRNAEALLVRMFREDPQLSDIEVKRAGLAEAFTELTNGSAREAA